MREFYAYIDESGMFQREYHKNHRYFVISLLMTDDPKRLSKIYKRSLLKIIKKDEALSGIFYATRELKGAEMKEYQKRKIYEDLVRLSDTIELGLIVVDMQLLNPRFKQHPARAFNYILKVYLQHYIKSGGIYENYDKLNLIIDERNVSTKSIDTLKEYLDTELVMAANIFNQDFTVNYFDSREQPLIQASDLIANTTLRLFNGSGSNVQEARENIDLLRDVICSEDLFQFRTYL